MKQHVNDESVSWDSLSLEDRVAATIYNVRAQSPREMTASRWLMIKERFGASARICLEEAREQIEEGEFDE